MSEQTCDGRGYMPDCPYDIYDLERKLCVFHSELPHKPIDKMQEALEGMKKIGEFDCRGWVIPFDVDLSNQEFKGDTRFDGASFAGGARFERASFTEYAGFERASFAEYASFPRASFAGLARFDEASFARDAWFEDASFAGDAWFNRASFSGDAQFAGASFAKYARFGGASFAGDAGFERASFAEYASFPRASFAGDARFDGTSFGEVASFWGARFVRGPDFPNLTFPRSGLFAETTFSVSTTLDGTQFGPGSTFARTDLHTVTFRRCHMGNVALAEAYGVAQAGYDQVVWGEWPAPRFWLSRMLAFCLRFMSAGPLSEPLQCWQQQHLPLVMLVREVVSEERLAHQSGQKADYDTAERVYREVRRSLEDHRCYHEAYLFAYREQEMRRLTLGVEKTGRWSWLWGQLRANLLSLEAMYLHLSDYGQSIPKPLLWLLVSVVLLFPLAYAAIGITLDHTTYSLGGQIWDPWPVIGFSLRTAALFSTENMPNIGGWGLVL